MRKVLVKLIAKMATLEMKVQKLEQAVQDIWGSCSCLNKDLDIDIDMTDDWDEDDLPEEPNLECPGSITCEKCGPDCFCLPDEEPIEEEDQGGNHE